MNKDVTKYKLPDGWTWTTIGEIAIVTSGGTPSTRKHEYWGDEIAWITPADLSNYNKKYITKGARSLTRDGLDFSSAKSLPKGSILFSSRAPIGYVVIAKNELTTNQGFKNIIPTKSLYSEYVYYYLKTIKSLAEGMASGTTFLELSATQFGQIPFPLAPLNEQHRIVAKIEEIFSELDHSEESLKKAQKQLEIYKQFFLKNVFEKREKGITYKISDIFKLIDGDRSKNYPKQSDYLSEGYCLFLSTKNVRLNRFVFGEKVFISKEKHEILKAGMLKRGDIVLTTRGTLGNVALYDETIPYSTIRINSGMIIMRAKKEKINLKYLSNYIISPQFKDQIKQKKSGTAQPQLPSSILKDFEIYVPYQEEQERIVLELETKFSLIENLENSIKISLQKTEAFRYTILKKAFEGKLVSQSAKDESAIKLLERIRTEKDAYWDARIEIIKKKSKRERTMENTKSILEILKETNVPIDAKDLWQQSEYKNDIDAFYAELKKIEEKIDIKTYGKKSLIGLKK